MLQNIHPLNQLETVCAISKDKITDLRSSEIHTRDLCSGHTVLLLQWKLVFNRDHILQENLIQALIGMIICTS